MHGDPADVGIVAQQRDLVRVDETHLALDPVPGIVGGPHARVLAGQGIAVLRMRMCVGGAGSLARASASASAGSMSVRRPWPIAAMRSRHASRRG